MTRRIWHCIKSHLRPYSTHPFNCYGSTYKLTLSNSGSRPRQPEGQPLTSIVNFSFVQISFSHITIWSTSNFESQCIDGFQSCEKMAMLVHKTMANLAHVLHNNRVKFPKLFVLFCSVHQHGGNDVRWKPPILLYFAACYKVPTIIFLIKWLNTFSYSNIWCHMQRGNPFPALLILVSHKSHLAT